MGVKALPEALHIARESDLDLVEVAPARDNGTPPVCRIMDYGKWKFDEAQRAKESRRKTTNVTIKEMKYRPKIAGGDFNTKTRKVAEFLGEGHKVKVTIMFRFRETHHPEFGRRILDRIAEQVAEIAKVESAPKLDGRNMVMVLAPDKRAQAAAAKPPKAEGQAKAEAQPKAEQAEQAAPQDAAAAEAPAENGATPTAATQATTTQTESN